jgi:hypothetical protein
MYGRHYAWQPRLLQRRIVTAVEMYDRHYAWQPRLLQRRIVTAVEMYGRHYAWQPRLLQRRIVTAVEMQFCSSFSNCLLLSVTRSYFNFRLSVSDIMYVLLLSTYTAVLPREVSIVRTKWFRVGDPDYMTLIGRYIGD